MLSSQQLISIIRDCGLKRQLHPSRVKYNHAPSSRRHSSNGPRPTPVLAENHAVADSKKLPADTSVREEGRMSSRLAQMIDESHAQKAIEEAGFSQELIQQLEERIKDSTFKSENPAAFAQSDMPSSAGEGTRKIAAATAWTGNESVEDAALRMLTDAHKPLRSVGPARYPVPRAPPINVDMRMKKAIQRSQGQRLANARDQTSVYTLSQDPNLTEHEKMEMRKVLQERFTLDGRPMPGTVQGLAALANQQIEDAMARGQFKNIARGKGKNIERDYTANSPFLDTTEYFMNKIIQKQEIMPPWIEKQQELVKSVQNFRRKLRADWKRHAARMIASKGGSLEAQTERARAYAAAEAATHPKTTKSEATHGFDETGRVSQVNVQTTSSPQSSSQDQRSRATIPKSSSISKAPALISSSTLPGSQIPPHSCGTSGSPSTHLEQPSIAYPFRDSAWESLELPYHTLALKSLNDLTRSYNLQAPDLAKKPYLSLARELRACFAEVAPLVPDEILARAYAPKAKNVKIDGTAAGGGMLERWQGGHVKIYESTKPNYGLKEFWRDLWRRKET